MHKEGFKNLFKIFILLLCKSIRLYKEIETAIIEL